MDLPLPKKYWEILEQLSDWRLLKGNSTPWSYLVDEAMLQRLSNA
jgi:hypothetical protein